jgi:SAM-dependent methyltransferase
MSTVVWHDLECGGYREDIAFWIRLATRHGGPILDVGAGTGRVAIELARAGHTVVALDADAELLGELAVRAAGLPLRTVCADAREFELGQRFPLCLVPMQTVQLLGGGAGRAAFLARAARHLRAGGVLAIAIAEQFEEFTVADGEPGPLPDIRELGGSIYSSRPTAVRRDGARFVLERRRERIDVAGAREVSHDVIALDLLDAGELEREGVTAGLSPLGVQEIAATAEHIGSRVVMLGG